MEMLMAPFAEDQSLSVPGCHHALPKFLPVCNIFHLPNVMDLKWPLGCFAIFAYLGIESSD